MVVLPIHSVEYLRNFVITKYGSPTNPFGSIFEEFFITKYGSPTNPFGSIFVRNLSLQYMVVLPIHSVVFEEFCHYKIW